MTTAITTARRRPVVRAPFRILAALICVLLIGVALGMTYMTWKRGVQTLRVQDVVMIPGWLWFGRLMLLAAAGGEIGPAKDPGVRNDLWPFATARVASVYWLIVLCISVAR